MSSNLRTQKMSSEEYAARITAYSHKDFLTINEAAFYFGVGIYKLRALANSDKGLAFTVPGGPKRRLIVREKLRQFIEDGGLREEADD